MERYIERLISPQILSEGVSYEKTTKIAKVETFEGGACNRVHIDERHALVEGRSSAEVNQGLGYIRQLEVLFDGKVPVCEFEFSSPVYGYRGFMMDVCRHFMPLDELKRIIDLMSMVGYNIFHWHLTDDQGWRFKVDGYPLLESIAAIRKNTDYMGYSFDYGGLYSDEELSELVSFCEKRGVTVIPEIEMPGHTKALLAAYPEFGCTGKKVAVESHWGIFEDVVNPSSEALWSFLDAAVSKLSRIFSGPYIHIGGDECPHVQWEANEGCIRLMEKNGLKDSYELQGWFTSKLARLVSSHGKRAMGWDEVVDAPSIDSSVVVMSWRGLEGARKASSRGHDVVLCPQQGMYMDKGYTPDCFEPRQWGVYSLKDSFSIDIGMQELPKEQRDLILGAQCNVWTERMANGRSVEYMLFPRVLVLADNLWLGPGRDWKKVCARRDAMRELCWKLNIVCSPSPWEFAASGDMDRTVL